MIGLAIFRRSKIKIVLLSSVLEFAILTPGRAIPDLSIFLQEAMMASERTSSKARRKRPNLRLLRQILSTNPHVVGYSEILQPEEVKGRPSGRMAIRIYVDRKIAKRGLPVSQRLPDEIDGIPVDVIAIGIPTQMQLTATAPPSGGVPTPAAHRLKYRPMVGGISVGPRLRPESGTLGYFLVGPPHARPQNPPCDWYILSCAHVLEPEIPGGREVIQPGATDHGRYPDEAVGIETEFTYDDMDAAVARIDEGAAGQILDLVAPVGTASPRSGMEVAKSGRTTGVTDGEIIDANLTITALHGPGRQYTRVILIRTGIRGEPFCAQGDSGSLVVQRLRRRAVGLLFAASDDLPLLPTGERSFRLGYAFPIARVLRAFPNRRIVAAGSHYPVPDPCVGGFI